jgi:hypothetical protein
VLGAMALTRYACAFLVLPALIFVGAFVPEHRWKVVIVLAVTFMAAVAPWIARNVKVSGAPFGAATFAMMEETRAFPGDQLERSLHPNIRSVPIGEYVRKCVTNVRDILTNDVPRLGGNWLWALFLAGLLVKFQSPMLSKLRWFVVLALATLIPVQAIIKTHISIESPEVNSENLLVLLSPLVLIFGTGVFFVLLDSFTFETARARFAAWTAFAAVMALPLGMTLLPPHPSPVVYPPYYPPFLQQVGSWLSPQEMMMSDIPAGIAWYGDRQCSALPLNAVEDLMEISDFRKPVAGVLLTTRTTEKKFLPDWMRGYTNSWEGFAMRAIAMDQVPSRFPLRRLPQGAKRDGQILLMDHDRWSREQREGRK